ncbi:sensor histidine kinase [Dinghuibacter silviterrae]|uniref:histidine kinase n=1 Tax=Dinghuibacter silviterrae TaxID=1539049 RepID=A0A4R8DQD0_9BACT|nr:ATP-binding protein [Dinghuibacter silviterrae]TDW99985.1 phospho-acceptor domain-containing protein [Dinghuibacter silviterrae]
MLLLHRRYRLLIVNVVYWFLLLYIIAELVWWFIALGRQNEKMAGFELARIRSSLDSASAPGSFNTAVRAVHEQAHMQNMGYIGEGGVFLIVLLLGAFYVYRFVRREMRLSGQQQNFMMAVTHELKTPIAVAKLSLETLARRKLGEEQQAKLIQSALSETERLNQLSTNILLAAQLEEGRYTQILEAVSLSDLVTRSVESFSGRFPGRLQGTHITPDLDIKGDPLLLELAVNNLIENALKYSPKDSPVQVTLSAEGHRAVVFRVADQGAGIPEEEKSMIFRKFYRVGNEQTRTTKGTGLGLYLSRAIVRKHRGQLSVTDNHPRGSIFSITFYI